MNSPSPPLVALTRAVSDSIAACELTHLSREPIDVMRARSQHRAYERALEQAGCRIVRAVPAHDLPDAVFVEDTAVVVDEVAIVTRPGAESRRAETAGIADLVRHYRDVRYIDPPGTIDGGDVLFCGRRAFVGRTSRTNSEGIGQIRAMLEPLGYSVSAVEVRGCLHLKSAATALSENQLLVNPDWVSCDDFRGFELLPVDSREPNAANILQICDQFIYSAAFPRTRALLERRFDLTVLDVSELAKAEGAVTCCSIVFRDYGPVER